MPKIQWLDLPPQLRQHLFDHAKERQITMSDLFALEEWRRHSPDGMSPEFWLNLQSLYELRFAESKAGKAIKVLPRLQRRKQIPA